MSWNKICDENDEFSKMLIKNVSIETKIETMG